MEIKAGDIVLCEFYFSDLKKYKKRPVLVLKDNLPFDDFVAIAISSKIQNLNDDEYILDNDMFEIGLIPKTSKLMLRKSFLVNKKLIDKIYGRLSEESLMVMKSRFCSFYSCR